MRDQQIPTPGTKAGALSLSWALYKNKTNTSPARESGTWEKLCSLFSAAARETSCTANTCPGKDCPEKDGLLFSPVVISGRRKEGNVQSLTIFVGDLDYITEEEEIAVRASVKGYAHILHSTHGHAPPKERALRLALALSSPFERAPGESTEAFKARWEAARAAIIEKFSLPADPSCKDLSRMYYLPTHRGDVSLVLESAHGAALDVERLLKEAKPKEEEVRNAHNAQNGQANPVQPVHFNGDRRLERASAYLARCDPGIQGSRGSYDTFRAAAKVIRGFSLNESEAFSLLWNEYNPRCQPPWSEKELRHKIKQAIDKGKDPWGGLLEQGDPLPKLLLNGEARAKKEAKKAGLEGITPEMTEASKEKAKAEQRALVDGMNKKHAVAMSGPNAVILTEGWDFEQRRPKVEFWKKQSFELYYQNRRVQLDGNKTVSLARFWLEAFERRQYDGITFAPGLDIPQHFNLWRGFAFKPKRGDWSLFWRHIVDNLCQGNKDYAGYLIAWMADLIQHPCRRTGVSVALKSADKGTGKGFFCYHFGRLLGPHYRQVTQTRHLVGNFNGHLADCLLLCADEAFWAGDKQAQGVIKGLITEHTTAIERKHQDVIEVPNRLRIIFNSNEDWIVPAGLDERRFFVLEVGSAQKQNRSYFAAIEKQLLSGGYEAMLYDLLHMDISGLDLGDVPQTAALLQQKEQSMTTEQRFWYGRLWNGELVQRREWEEWTPTDELYGAYLRESKDVGERRRKIEMDFSREIKRLCPGVLKKQVTVDVWEQFRGEWRRDSQRKRCFKFPPLEECRKAFKKAIRMPIDWPAVESEAGDEG